MDYGALLPIFGPTGALLVLALITGRMGMWVWGRELEDARSDLAATEARHKADTERFEARHVAEVARLEALWRERYREQEADYDARLVKLEAATARWEELTLRVSGVAEKATVALGKVVKP